jgi:hypothetical protein
VRCGHHLMIAAGFRSAGLLTFDMRHP